MPIDITFVDIEGNIKFYFDECKIFSRARTILNRSIMLCHPIKLVPVIEKLFEDFKTKKRRSMEVWKYVQGKPISIKYLAVYDDSDEYIGTVELVEDHSEALKRFSK